MAASGMLNLGGPGMFIPDVRQEDQKYCGPVHLIVSVDGANLGMFPMKDTNQFLNYNRHFSLKITREIRCRKPAVFNFGNGSIKMFSHLKIET